MNLNLTDLNDLIKCFNCQKDIEIPIVLSCGFSVCLDCCRVKQSIDCFYCNSTHLLNPESLIPNQIHLKLLNIIKRTSNYNPYDSIDDENDKFNSQDKNKRLSLEFSNSPSTRHMLNEIASKSSSFRRVLWLNNEYNYVKINLKQHFPEISPICSSIKVLSSNRVLFLYELLYGKVVSTFLNIINLNGQVENKKEINFEFTYYSTDYVYGDFILILFRKTNSNYILHFYDSSLTLIQEKSLDLQIAYIVMNDSKIYIITNNKKAIVNEYDYKLNKICSFGQVQNEKKGFYIKGEIFYIRDEFIFSKSDDDVLIMSKGNGELVSKIKIDDLKISQIFKDNDENYLVFNRYNKLTLFNKNGQMLIHNKIRFKEKFDEFFLLKSGRFVFIDKKTQIVLII